MVRSRSHGLSIQAFGILGKIREVDRLMTPALQGRVYEAHPELAFRSLAGAPMRHSKKTPAGREETPAGARTAGVVSGLFESCSTRSQPATGVRRSGSTIVWMRVSWPGWPGGSAPARAQRLPAQPPLDARGLRMEIWY